MIIKKLIALLMITLILSACSAIVEYSADPVTMNDCDYDYLLAYHAVDIDEAEELEHRLPPQSQSERTADLPQPTRVEVQERTTSVAQDVAAETVSNTSVERDVIRETYVAPNAPVGREPTIEESLASMSREQLESHIQLYHDRGLGDQIPQIFFDMLARFD